MAGTNPVNNDFWFATENGREASEATDSFAAKLAAIDGLKTFPVVAQKIISILSKTDFKVTEVINALNQDPSLASGLLRMANSAFFAGSQPVSSIDQGFIRLGRKTVMEVVVAVATMDLFPDVGGVGKGIRDHMASVAAIGRVLASYYAPKEEAGVFLSGLLHDVGKMLLIESGEFDYVLEGVDPLEPQMSHVEEREIIGYDHAVLGAHVLANWAVPDPVPLVVAWHHQPQRAYADSNIGPKVALLRVAGRIDYAITSNQDHEQYLNRYVESDDFKMLKIDIDSLKDKWEELVDVRREALALFGEMKRTTPDSDMKTYVS